MRTQKQSVHWLFRNALAAIFWCHAVGLTRLLYQVPGWNHLSTVLTQQIVVGAVILFYSYTSTTPAWSLVVDLLYVYVAPVVLLSRFLWVWMKKFGRALVKASPTLGDAFNTPTIKPPNETAEPKVTTEGQDGDKQRGWAAITVAPFFSLAFCWCILSAISSQRWVEGLVLIALVVSTIKLIFALHHALDDASSLMDKVNLTLRKLVEKFTNELSKAAPDSKSFKDSITNLRLYGALFHYLSSTAAVRKVTRQFTLAIAVPAYIYTSLLCGFLYHDIAQLSGIQWPLGESLVDALFMPIAFTDLPHNYLIRILGGAQVASLILIGYDAIFRSINENMERLATAAHGLNALIETDAIKSAMNTYDATAKEIDSGSAKQSSTSNELPANGSS